MPDGIRRAVTADARAISDVLVQAFMDDPGTIIFEPDRERRATILPAFFGAWVRAALADGGDLVVPEGPVATGVASWFGPASDGPSEEALRAAGWDEVLVTFGDDAATRMLEMTGELDRRHDILDLGPHLRLEFFGVRPSAQRAGVGTRLIEHGHRVADGLGVPCALETFTLENVAYYRRRGWNLVAEYEVAGGIPVYQLVREPRRSS